MTEPSISAQPANPARPEARRGTTVIRAIVRVLLGLFLLAAGISHLTILREAFQAQVPPWLPFDTDFVVLASGVVEILLGLAVLFIRRWRAQVGWVVALFFLAVFPGNIAQFFTSVDRVGWRDAATITLGVRLLFQPLLVAWALAGTCAWRSWRERRRERR